MLHKRDGDMVSEFPVDPAQIATALSAKTRFETGILNPNTIFVRQEEVKKVVVEYREPQKTGVYLDGSENAVRAPLPGLLLIRTLPDGKTPEYLVYAMKKRPLTLDEPLFHAPLPNIYSSASICWGSVPKVTAAAMNGTSLEEDWKMLLGSGFGTHSASGKSKSHPKDIRTHLISLEKRKTRTYPISDLIPFNKTLAEVLK